MIHALIDGDWIIYAAGFAGQKTELVYYVDASESYGPFPNVTAIKERIGGDFDPAFVYSKIIVDPLEHVLHSAKNMLDGALDRIEDHFGEPAESHIFVDGDGNFRSRLGKIRPYKGQRRPDAKPILYNEIRQYLIEHRGAQVVYDMETDDELAVFQTHNNATGRKSMIVGVDKDLLQVPGWHMNPNKGFMQITPERGLQRLYAQAAEGDTVDNIGGCYKVGKVTARKTFGCMTDEAAMWDTLVDMYQTSVEKYGPDTYRGLSPHDAALENMRLVYLKRTREEGLWLPPGERK